ncbi:sigma-54 dependent transcriptional regulator [uncultured Aquimarina sp.]|uniref:sigma-54-dependent transcriptional regulator n=1 Tax=uncultured Aquimarina sp. TaxID=575652 RepID=UPI0026313DDE|nr:sigma-54 dependent transcriptional regulator [uncultured Aquimarina sp.]
MSKKLLIVEDEFLIANNIRSIVSQLGYAVMGVAKSAVEALKAVEGEKPDLALLDINIIGKTNGIDLAKVLRKKYGIKHLFITSYSDNEIVEEMNHTRPLGYILKPFDERDIRVALRMAVANLNATTNEDVPNKSKTTNKLDIAVVGNSPKFLEALKKVALVAPTDITVLLTGETGVGKEVMMQAIFDNSTKNTKKLVKVNCAALPSELIESVLFGHEKGSFTGATEKRIGKFEQANGGTIFLDEIGELPLTSQSKLLRTLQEKEIESVGSSIQKKIDVRVIAATNKNLSQCVKEGTFRADLYFRISTFPIAIPSLWERKEDILLLSNYFINQACERFNRDIIHLSKESEKRLLHYSWPGNVRELQHVIDRSILLNEGETLEIKLDEVNSQENTGSNEFQLKSLEEIEREQIIETLKYTNGKIRGKEGAAEILKLHPNTLDFRIKKLGINKDINYN